MPRGVEGDQADGGLRIAEAVVSWWAQDSGSAQVPKECVLEVSHYTPTYPAPTDLQLDAEQEWIEVAALKEWRGDETSAGEHGLLATYRWDERWRALTESPFWQETGSALGMSCFDRGTGAPTGLLATAEARAICELVRATPFDGLWLVGGGASARRLSL